MRRYLLPGGPILRANRVKFAGKRIKQLYGSFPDSQPSRLRHREQLAAVDVRNHGVNGHRARSIHRPIYLNKSNHREATQSLTDLPLPIFHSMRTNDGSQDLSEEDTKTRGFEQGGRHWRGWRVTG